MFHAFVFAGFAPPDPEDQVAGGICRRSKIQVPRTAAVVRVGRPVLLYRRDEGARPTRSNTKSSGRGLFPHHFGGVPHHPLTTWGVAGIGAWLGEEVRLRTRPGSRRRRSSTPPARRTRRRPRERTRPELSRR